MPLPRTTRGGSRLAVPVCRALPLRCALLFLCAGLAAGCASSRSAEDDAAGRAAALGTWRYEVDGSAPLSTGVFQIAERKGRLQGFLRDRRRGRLQARVKLQDRRLELTVDGLRVSGRIEEGQFTGVLRRERWDMTTRRRTRRRTRSRVRSASVHARRVRSASAADRPSILECESILREANGCD